jgi:2-polyprenyl-3-methyl-5-hydroxy-6-metoxy-1,4-benzoquinol methylase
MDRSRDLRTERAKFRMIRIEANRTNVNGDTALPMTSLADFRQNAASRYGELAKVGRNIRRRLRLGYYSPQEHYEVILDKLVGRETSWLDVGCGCTPLPGHAELARRLGERCRLLVGVDPDVTIHENETVHRKVQSSMEDFNPDEPFDLVTLRMVCEHVQQPELLARRLNEVTIPGARVVILTPSLYSVTSTIGRLTPHRLHHAIKAILWGTRKEDTFPVRFRMNTRRRLEALMRDAGFYEEHFQRLADASIFWKSASLHAIELGFWRSLPRAWRAFYPDSCLLAVYRKAA